MPGGPSAPSTYPRDSLQPFGFVWAEVRGGGRHLVGGGRLPSAEERSFVYDGGTVGTSRVRISTGQVSPRPRPSSRVPTSLEPTECSASRASAQVRCWFVVVSRLRSRGPALGSEVVARSRRARSSNGNRPPPGSPAPVEERVSRRPYRPSRPWCCHPAAGGERLADAGSPRGFPFTGRVHRWRLRVPPGLWLMTGARRPGSPSAYVVGPKA